MSSGGGAGEFAQGFVVGAIANVVLAVVAYGLFQSLITGATKSAKEAAIDDPAFRQWNDVSNV